MRATTLAAGGLACVGAAMTIAAFTAGGDEPVRAAAPNGLSVFIAQGCGSCHRFAAAESTGPIGPDLDVALQGQDRAYVEQAILAPPSDGPMPDDFATRISPPDLDRLVDFLLAAQ